ncbi:MAG: LysR family transcriptional regulator [Lachnospiraceae bacterium]|nr:LysR family transcriptional regulator [Lachnospiraceae bacterium]
MVDPKLYSLIRVYETGSFTKAASQLSLTQPAVSQHIQSLEKSLGLKIFERSSNTLRVTREGELVVKCARRMLSLYNNLKDELVNEKRSLTNMTVGVTHTAESNPFAEALAKYAHAHDNVTVKMISDASSVLYTRLKNYELDFAIVEGRIPDPSLDFLLLDTDCLVLAVPPAHRLADNQIVSISDLKKERLILRLPESNTRNLFVASLESKNMRMDEFNVVMEIDNIATIKDLVRREFGVSVLAKSACLDELHKNKLVLLPIENLTMAREINLVYKKDFDHPDVLKEIVSDYNEVRGDFINTPLFSVIAEE